MCHAQGHGFARFWSHTSDAACQGEGKEGRAQQGLFYAPKVQMWKVVAQHTNTATAFRTQIHLTQEKLTMEESKLREAVTDISPSSSSFQHKVFPRQMWLLCISLAWTSLLFAGALLNVPTADQGIVVVPQAPASHGKVHLLFCVLNFFSPPPGLSGGKKGWKSSSSPSWQCQYVFNT